MRSGQRAGKRDVTLEWQHETPKPCVVKQVFVAAWQRRPDGFTFGRAVPFRGGRYRSGMSGKRDVHRRRSVVLSKKLPDIKFARVAHVRRARVTQVRVVRPKDQPGVRTTLIEEGEQLLDGLSHVFVAQVP